MIFVKNLKFLPILLYFKTGLDMLFANVVHTKEGFLGYKHVILTSTKDLYFTKGVNSLFWSEV